jgi:transposase
MGAPAHAPPISEDLGLFVPVPPTDPPRFAVWARSCFSPAGTFEDDLASENVRAESGIVAPVGRNGMEQLLEVVADAKDTRLPEIARACVAALGTQLLALKAQILAFDRRIMAWHRSNETSKRLDEIPGVGPVLATALVACIADPKAFRSGRDFSAWIGLVPKQNSSGGKEKLGSISKQGDRYLRSLFTAGALAVIRYAKIHVTKQRPWLTALLARRPTRVAAIALANKIARMVWAMMTRGERYKEPVALAA